MFAGSVGSPYLTAAKAASSSWIVSSSASSAPSGGWAWRSPGRRACTPSTANGTVAARSASSRTRFTDLPPSSRNVGFSVEAAASMMRRPVAVEPVKATMSTSGEVVMTSPTRWSDDVTMLTTPGGMSVCSAMSRPRRSGAPRRVRRRLEHAGVAHGQDRAELVQRDLDREVPRHDHADDADRLLPDLALGLVADAERVLRAERPRSTRTCRSSRPASAAPPQRARRAADRRWAAPGSRPRRPARTGAPRPRPRCAACSCRMAALRQRVVGRPVGGVEGPAGRVDGRAPCRPRSRRRPGRAPLRWPG